ncbi:hypothetical protein GCM10023340_30310 [Nocardioides marinquilinus]|uniref:Bacterial Ig-like domain-containing protein n=1 Tax=Nocardioides marinquilinus TaxID=1210400 RepID=A0ABP9PT37_9ACTN
MLRRLPTLLAGLVVAAGLVALGPARPAQALDSPSGLAATDAAIPVLSWTRVPGATGYDVELSRSSEFTSATRIGSVVSTTNVRYVPTVQLPTDGVWWRVRAKSAAGTGDYTSSSFAPAATRAPVMVRPQPDAHFQAPEAPYFTWEPVAGATSYVVQTGRDPLFTDPGGIVSSTQRTTAAYLTSYPTTGQYYWRVRAELSSGYWTAWSDSRPYVVDGLPQVRRTAPDDTFETSVRDVVLDWEPVEGAVTYELQVNTDDAFGTATMKASPTGIVATQWSAGSTLNNDEYFWRVRAVDASGKASPWPDTPWRLRRAWPDQPTLVHPRGVVDGSAPFFLQWNAIERASRYEVLMWDDTGRQVCGVQTVHTTLAACVPSKAGEYTWKVRATDGPSSVITDLIAQPLTAFTYQPSPSPVPAPAGSLTTSQVTGHAAAMDGTSTLVGPGRDACTATIPATCVDLRQTPVLSWDPVPGAVGYLLTLAHDRELTNVVPGFDKVSVPQPMYTFTKTLPDSQAGSAYFWVVQPCGQTCAPIEYPKTSFAKKTLAPRLLSPATDALVSDDVTLDWTPYLDTLRAPRPADDTSSLATPAGTEAQTYTVETSLDPLFTSRIETATVDETTYTSPASTYPEGYVHWRVRANDGTGNPSVWSEARRFEKRSPRPTLLTPGSGGPLGSDLTFSWDPLAFAGAYELEIMAGPTTVVSQKQIKYTSWAPTTPLPASTEPYRWRVRRVDAKNLAGEWTDYRTFTVDALPVATASPDDGALVEPTGGLFSWLPDPRATSYRFERRKPGETTGSLAESVSTRATAWAPTSALPAGTAQWRVVAIDAAGKDLGASPWRTFVVVDPPAVATPVTISGSGKVGTELRLSAPTFDPPAETTTYQWYRGTSVISGATGETYTVTAADRDKDLTVRATGALTGYRNASSTSDPIRGVVGDALVAAYPPAIDGDPVVGKTLTVAPGSWSDGPRLTYQWYRDGVAISRATSTTYRLVSDDVGRQVHVVEKATLTGREDGSAASDPVSVTNAGALVALDRPVVTGRPAPGNTLTADPGTWSGPASLTYQWFRNGVAVPGAVRSTYAVTAVDAARRLHVVVTARAADHDPGTAASRSVTVNKVRTTTALTLTPSPATTKQRVTATATVAASGLAGAGGTVTFYDGTRKLAKVTVRGTTATTRLPLLKAGKHTVKAVYSGGAQATASTRSARLTVTKR